MLKYFGTDGVRGVANKTLTLNMAYRIGSYLGNYAKKLNNPKIVIGKDTRKSSSMFEHMLASAIVSSGADVYLLGYCSTPALAYIAESHEFALGIMISASHNPYYDNGIKIFDNHGFKFNDEELEKVEAYMDEPQGIEFALNGEIGEVNDYQKAVKDYEDWLINLYPLDLSNYKILVDCANGSNYKIAKEVLEKLNCQVTCINDLPNGTNINNGCGSTHLESLKENILLGKYDLGLAFDGDADRLQVVNSKGKELNGDYLLYILAKYLKEKNLLNNNCVVVTAYSNIGLHKALNKLNINTAVVENGDRFVLESMIKNDYVLGGEQSGHIIIKKDCNFGDGLKTALCLLSSLSYFKQSIDELSNELIIYPQLLVNQKVEDKKKIMQDEDILNKVAKIKEILGCDGQILVRASGTEPLIRVMVEASNKDLCQKYVDEVLNLIKQKDQ